MRTRRTWTRVAAIEVVVASIAVLLFGLAHDVNDTPGFVASFLVGPIHGLR